MRNKRAMLVAGVIAAVLIIDQVVKMLVKLNMVIGEEIYLTSWFRIHFVENNGMAFGMELGGDWGKLVLSLFRLVAIGAIGWFICGLCKDGKKVSNLFLVTISMVFAGAVGNIIDSVFYGVCFSSSWGNVAEFLPAAGGYAGWLHGRVVDMLFFPLLQGFFPEWMPFCGGEEFMFFRPVFNIADSSICVGIAIMLLFCKNELNDMLSDGEKKPEEKKD